MLYIEDEDFLNKEQKKYIDDVICGGIIPFFHNSSSVHGVDNYSFLTHVIVKRRHERKTPDEINSPQFEFMKSILDSFCNNHNIKYNEILRCAINYTYHNGAEASPIHIDEEDEHKQLIVYLNQPEDLNSKTVILNDDSKTILKSITPKIFKGVCFDDKPHYAIYPKIGHRVIGVFTFR